MGAFLRRLIREDDGQDLVEYALLAAFVAIAGIGGLSAIQAALHSTYLNWGTATQDLWLMPDPK
jgi:Flp pilus assembly pilin Flp